MKAPATTALSVALAGAALVAVVLALWLLPPWLVDQAGPDLMGAELTRAVTEERRNVLAGLVAIGAAVTLWYTHQRQELDRDANRTGRYTKAVKQLGDDTKPSVQLGGVYALERVANDSRRDRAVSIEVLSAFVRQQSKTRAVDVDTATAADEADSTVDSAASAHDPSEPVLAAFSVLARRLHGDRTYPHPNLEGAYVPGARLTGANLTGANLRGADLVGADLVGADLAGSGLQYRLYGRNATTGQAFQLIQWDITGLSWTHSILVPGNTYQYFVRSWSTTTWVESKNSATVQAVAP